jgi:hypothetical protein
LHTTTRATYIGKESKEEKANRRKQIANFYTR